MAQCKAWCFTLNNYSDFTLERLRCFGASPNCAYLLFGKEVGENGTPHLQGFVKYTSRQRMAGVKIDIGENCHVEIARNVPASVTYCKKDGNFEEFGDLTGQGYRSDLDTFKADVKGGMLSLREIRERHSEVYAKYPRFCMEYIEDNRPSPDIEMHPLRDWQAQLYGELMGPVDNRKIIFMVDSVGNSGKSWFAHYYCKLHDNAQVLLPGKKADMSFCLRSDLRCLFIDAPRSKQGEFLQYDFFEEIKNCYVFSAKYESQLKRLSPCHLVVLMNEHPDMTKLSEDRYDVRVL